MKVIECRGADMRAVNEAVEALRSGNIVIYPTDSVYALGCDALNARAVERLCKIKGINPDKHFLSVVCSDISMAAEYARIDNRAFALLKRYLPGPFTFILPVASKLPKVFRGRKCVGVRIPGNEFATALADALGNPVMSTSAVPDDAENEVDVREIAAFYGNPADIEIAIEDDEHFQGHSTVVDVTDSYAPTVIRRGAGDFEE